MSRFEFLQRDFPELYERCRQAEEATDIDVIMLKCRQALEWMVKDLGGQQNNLFFDISELSDKGILPDNISHMFHDVRMMANHSVHKNETMSCVQAQNCLNQLLELTIWFAVQHDKKYDLTAFSSQDVAVARKYLKSAKTAMGGAGQTLEENVSIDPLSLQEDFAIPEDEPQDILAKDVFETQAEYEQRIADMEPIHIGYGILDTRRKDGYTNVIFLIHHVDRNAKIQFADIDAFFANDAKVDGIVDDELVANLKVYDGKVCCDYEKVYLRNDEDLIPLQVVKWDKFAYETDEAYKNRIENLPIIPFGVAQPLRNKYNLENETLPLAIKAFHYTEKIVDKLFSHNNKLMTISCNRDIARIICYSPMKVIMFGKISLPLKWKVCLFWQGSVGEFYRYDVELMEKRKQAEQGDVNAQLWLGDFYYKKCLYEDEYFYTPTIEENGVEAFTWYQKAAEQGNVRAQAYLGDCYCLGEGVEENEEKAFECYQEAAKQNDAHAKHGLGSCYYWGDAVEQNYEKAVEWFQKAAQQGDTDAQIELGNCYREGKGVKKDIYKALEWYQKAINQGDNDCRISFLEAQCELGDAYYDGKGAEQNYEKAVEWYRKAAKQGLADAQNKLGVRYEMGEGVEQDYEQAAKWYKKSANQGDMVAQYNLGDCYYYGNGVEQDYKKAVELYEESAKQGYAKAQNDLGNCYYSGKGVEKSYERAAEWYEKAADQEYSWAQKNLGNCYYDGEGVEQDYKQAVEWYEKAAKQGNATAQNNLGNCYYNGKGVEKSYEKAVEWYEKAAQQGNLWAQNNLGECYYDGEDVEKSYEKAVELYQKAANQNLVSAQNHLGNCYYNGRGVEQDYKRAVKWYEKAAKRGYAKAQSNLGTCYYNGEGVEKNYEKAVEWYQKAAKQGNARAQDNLGVCYYSGEGVEKSYEKAVELYQKAANQNLASAQNHLGVCYDKGRGVEQDDKQAVKWCEKAAKQGYSKGQYNLGMSYQYGRGVEQDKSKAIEWYQKAADQGNEDAKKKLQELLQERETPNVRQLEESNSKSSGCFITTAVCISFQKPDDCYELTQFRKFRDNWLFKQADGPLLIDEYYRIAPSIVAQIDAHKDAKRIYKAIWGNYLQPCLFFIESKDFTACKNLYVQMVRNLQAKYNS